MTVRQGKNEMIDERATARAEKLIIEYERTYGKEPDLSDRPRGLTQTKLVPVLRLMIRDNVSLLSAYRTLFLSSGKPSDENAVLLSEYQELYDAQAGIWTKMWEGEKRRSKK